MWYWFFFFFFNDTATTEIYTLSLHDALPISLNTRRTSSLGGSTSATGSRTRSSHPTFARTSATLAPGNSAVSTSRSEEHTSELQSRQYLVCRLLLEKKKNKKLISIQHSLILR